MVIYESSSWADGGTEYEVGGSKDSIVQGVDDGSALQLPVFTITAVLVVLASVVPVVLIRQAPEKAAVLLGKETDSVQ